MWVADSGNVEGVLTCSMSYWVRHQYTHRITFSPLSFTVKVFRRYCLSHVNCRAPNCKAALIWSYVIPLTFSGGGIQSVFPGKAFANSVIAIHSKVRFSPPVSATPESNVHNFFSTDISQFIHARPKICVTNIRGIHHQWGPNGFV